MSTYPLTAKERARWGPHAIRQKPWGLGLCGHCSSGKGRHDLCAGCSCSCAIYRMPQPVTQADREMWTYPKKETA